MTIAVAATLWNGVVGQGCGIGESYQSHQGDRFCNRIFHEIAPRHGSFSLLRFLHHTFDILAPVSTPFIYNIGIQRKKDVGVCTSAYLGSRLSHCLLTEISNAASPRRDVCVCAHTLHCGLPLWASIAEQCSRIWHTLSSSGRSPLLYLPVSSNLRDLEPKDNAW